MIEDETSHTLERNLGYNSRPLLPTKELRFNKFKYVSDEYAKYYADFKPLISKDYPIYGYVNKTLRICERVRVAQSKANKNSAEAEPATMATAAQSKSQRVVKAKTLAKVKGWRKGMHLF
jgi:hypothetical protein